MHVSICARTGFSMQTRCEFGLVAAASVNDMDGNMTSRKKRMSYTPVEDTLILQGVQTCGREWRSVLSFIRRHVEILGEAGEQYLVKGQMADKALQERIRKRATKLLNERLSSR